MASLQETLSKKFGPLPLYGWVGIGGGVLALLYIRGQSSSSGTPAAQDQQAQQQGVSPSPIIVTPTTAALPSPAPVSGPSLMTSAIVQPWAGSNHEAWLFSGPGTGSVVATIPSGTSVPVSGTPIQGQPAGDPNHQSGWYPVSWGGLTGYLSAADIGSFTQGQSSGGMGGGPLKTIGRVGRFNSPHVKKQFLALPGGMGGAPNLEPQYGSGWRGPTAGWYGMGGGGAIRHMSKRTGIPEERLAALNPGLWRPGVVRRQRHMVIG